MIEPLEHRRLLSYTRPFGDANNDRLVNTLDFTAVSLHFNKQGSTLGQASGEFNLDNRVNTLDFNIVANHFGAPVPAFDPAIHVPGLKVSLDADSLALTDGSPVANWPGSDGTSFAAVQPNADIRPRLRLNTLGSHKGVEFDGFNDFLQLTGVKDQLSGAATSVIVFDLWEDDSYTLLGTSSNQGIDRFWETAKDYSGTFRQTRLDAQTIDMPTAGSHVLVVQSKNGAWEMTLDGTTLLSTSTNSFSCDNDWCLGAWWPYDYVTGTGSFRGTISRTLIYDNFIASDDVQDVSQWAISTYQLNQGVLPADPVWTGGTGKRYWHVFLEPFREKIWIGESDDGIDVVNEGEIQITGYNGPARDPSYYYADGVHYIAFSNTSVANMPGSSTTDTFTIIKSTDGVHWNLLKQVNLAGIYSTPHDNYTWAPQWFKDDDGSLSLIVSCSDDRLAFKFYSVPVLRLSPFSTGTPVQLDTPVDNVIDAQIIKRNGMYEMIVAPGAVRMMQSTSLFGTYTAPVDISPYGREGPCWVPFDDEIRIYFDGGSSRYAISTDGGVTFPAVNTTRSRFPQSHGDVVDRHSYGL